MQRKRDEHMLRVNEDHGARRPVSKPLPFEEFWTERFVPSMKTRALAPRTVKRIPGDVGPVPGTLDRPAAPNEFHAPDLSGDYRWFERQV